MEADRVVVNVDSSACRGHGRCYGLAPSLYRPKDDDGHSEFIGEPIEASDEELMKLGSRTIKNCPEHALSWAPAPIELRRGERSQ